MKRLSFDTRLPASTPGPLRLCVLITILGSDQVGLEAPLTACSPWFDGTLKLLRWVSSSRMQPSSLADVALGFICSSRRARRECYSKARLWNALFKHCSPAHTLYRTSSARWLKTREPRFKSQGLLNWDPRVFVEAAACSLPQPGWDGVDAVWNHLRPGWMGSLSLSGFSGLRRLGEVSAALWLWGRHHLGFYYFHYWLLKKISQWSYATAPKLHDELCNYYKT